MDAEFLLGIVKSHFGSILVFALVVFGWWRGGFEKISSAVQKVEDFYDRLRKKAEERRVYELLKKAYDFANDEAARLVKKTDTEVDDKIVDKSKIALEWAMKALDKAGLGEHADEDVIKGYFGHFHEAERKATELSGKLLPPGNES